MHETAVTNLSVSVRRRRRWPTVEWGSFFLFFGVSGTDHGREARLERRFELEHFSNLVTLGLASPLEPGAYALRGLPDEANKRGWTVGADGRRASGNLSDDGLHELRAWMQRQNRQVRAEALSPPA